MDPVICTPRLKLVLVTKVETESVEFDSLHDLYANEKSTWWSIYGRSKSPTETATRLGYILPQTALPDSYRVLYAVHRFLDNDPTDIGSNPEARPTEFIGIINLKSLDQGSLALPSHLNHQPSTTSEDPTLTVEIAYMFLPTAWGVGYATESIMAMYAACQRNLEFWAPFTKVYVRALVNATNPPSLRVMAKVGMEQKGVYEWQGKAVFLAGKWRERDSLVIWGRDLLV